MKKYLFLIVTMMFMLLPMGVSASTQSDYVDTQVRKIISELNISDADAYHKVLAINDYMYDNFEFTRTFTPDSAYTLLKNGGSNCQGFCQLFIELTKKVGIESAMVYQDYMDHRWNVVKMDDGKWYFVDVASERYISQKHYRFLKGTKGFYYTMNSRFNYDMSETDYKYNPNKPVEEVKPEEPVQKPTEAKPQETTSQKPTQSSGGANAGVTGNLFSFSKSVPNFGNALKAIYNAGFNIKIPIVSK